MKLGLLLWIIIFVILVLPERWTPEFVDTKAGSILLLGGQAFALVVMLFAHAIEKLDKRLRALESTEHVDIWSPVSGVRAPVRPGPECPECGVPLRTERAKQCMCCGLDLSSMEAHEVKSQGT